MTWNERESGENRVGFFLISILKIQVWLFAPSSPSRTSVEPRQSRPRHSPRPTSRQNPRMPRSVPERTGSDIFLQLLVSSPSRDVALS